MSELPYTFVLSQLLQNYIEDGGFTGSSMGKAVTQAQALEDNVVAAMGYPNYDDSSSHRRLSTLLHQMYCWGWDKEDMAVAVCWAKQLEGGRL